MANPIQSVLVAGTNHDEIESLLPFAEAIAWAMNARVCILGLVPMAAGTSLSAGALEARRLRRKLQPGARRADSKLVVHVTHDLWDEVKETVRDEKAARLILHWQSIPTERWLRSLHCEVSIVKPPFPAKGCRILLPIRGGQYAARTLQVALAIADHQHGEITVLHAAPATAGTEDADPSLLQHLRELPQVTRWINARGDAPQAILRAARGHQLVIMGAIAHPRPGEPAIGPTATRVLNRTKTPALVVRARRAPTTFAARLLELIPGIGSDMTEPEHPPVDYTISVVVDKWFAENTFHANEFKDLKQLVQEKRRQGLTISLGLPTLNEEKTIGKIVKMVRERFVEDMPLLDEIVVIDSESTDRTVQIVRDLGVRVIGHPQILPEHGALRGKGEALWKSLFELRGDLIAWIDTDIVNIHPRFIYGILGPLVTRPELMYVKGFYQRPLRLGKKLEARGGGRVTELSARPLLNLFYPKLSGFVQPLSGEYAGRRAALESVPFFSGYGVEVGLLIDIYAKFGLQAIGQVDLQERIHRNQSLIALSKMAFEITQVIMQRVGEGHKVELVKESNKSMKLIRYARNEFQLDVADIRTIQREPMLSVKEYRELRGIKASR